MPTLQAPRLAAGAQPAPPPLRRHSSPLNAPAPPSLCRYYSLFTLVMLVSFECTVVGQRLRNLSDVRKLQAPKQVGARSRGWQARSGNLRSLPAAAHGVGLVLRGWPCAPRAPMLLAAAGQGVCPLHPNPPLLCPMHRSRSLCTATASGASCRATRCCQETLCRSHVAPAQVGRTLAKGQAL